jgi:2-isopropylmalate synthase
LLRYNELGYDLTSAELDAAYSEFTSLADRKKRIYDQDLISLLTSDRTSEEATAAVA